MQTNSSQLLTEYDLCYYNKNNSSNIDAAKYVEIAIISKSHPIVRVDWWIELGVSLGEKLILMACIWINQRKQKSLLVNRTIS